MGIMTIIDGAHVPAHIPLDLKDLDPDVYTGACHKWMLAPKGSSFLYVRKSYQPYVDPLVISWGYEAEFPSASQFQDYHQFQGTRDFSAFLATKDAIQFLADHKWEEKTRVSKDQLQYFYPIVAKALDSYVLCPVTDEFLGQICSIPIRTKDPFALKDLLYDTYKIEIPVVSFSGDIYLRISFQAYNGEREIETLLDALKAVKSKTNLLTS